MSCHRRNSYFSAAFSLSGCSLWSKPSKRDAVSFSRPPLLEYSMDTAQQRARPPLSPFPLYLKPCPIVGIGPALVLRHLDLCFAQGRRRPHPFLEHSLIKSFH